MAIKLVAIDLDGTVVNEELQISKQTKSIISHLINETDVKVVVATGRMFLSALSFVRELGIKEPVISYQGAMIRELDKDYTHLYHNPIPLDLATELLTYLSKDKLAINLYMNDKLWTTHNNPHALSYANAAGIEPQYTEDLLPILTVPPTKLMIIDDYRVDELVADIQEEFPGKLMSCRSKTNFCEMIDIQSSKWNALKILMKNHQISEEEVLAIGDQGNDISMIVSYSIFASCLT